MKNDSPLVGIVMGSTSDWDTMKTARDVLAQFGVPHECRVLSAHRTPGATVEYVGAAQARGMEVMIAAAGGAAHLAGVVAAHTLLPVLGVPMRRPCARPSATRHWRGRVWASMPRRRTSPRSATICTTTPGPVA